MKLIDTFLFYNEDKMLDFRLNYYKDVVDYFIIVEATKTFSGIDKPLYFEAIKHKYSHIKNIIHIVVRDMPEQYDISQQIPKTINWQREYYQRNYIKEALKQVPNISDEDWIIIADVDEIANRDKLKTVRLSYNHFSSYDKIGYTLEFDMYYYNITSKLNNKWYKCKLMRYHVVKSNDLNTIRDVICYPLLIEFGWHFSYFFSPEMIKNKIQAFSHQEYNEDKFTNKEYIEDCIKNGKSLFHLDKSRTEKIIYTPTETNNNLPNGYEKLNNYNIQLKSSDITLVTAFYDIGRGNWKTYNRSVDLYFNSFKNYLYLPYNIVAFIDDRYIDKLPKYDNVNFKVIPINYQWLITNSLCWKDLQKVKNIMENEYYKDLVKDRILQEFPENIHAEYNIINHSKIDFIYYGIMNHIITSDFICWSDFGYHNSILKNNPSNYPYAGLDISKFNKDKLNFWLRNNPINNDFDIIKTLIDPREVFTGSLFGGPLHLILKLYYLYHNQLNFMYNKGISDDDQHVYLRCYLNEPHIFELHISNNEWPKALVNCQFTFTNRMDLIKHLIQYKNNIVEIGVCQGELSDFILSNNTNCTLYCVDPYISYNDYEDSCNNIVGDQLYNKVTNRLVTKYNNRVKMIRNFSSEALKYIDSPIDFVYIDGNHSYKYVLEDITLWFEKLSPGGIIIGDDAVDIEENKRDNEGNIFIEWCIGCSGKYGVIKAFRDFCYLNNLTYYKITNQIVLFKPLHGSAITS